MNSKEPIEHARGGNNLQRRWFIALVIIAAVAWLFVGASGLMPRWIWLIILAALLLSLFALALFAPRRN